MFGKMCTVSVLLLLSMLFFGSTVIVKSTDKPSDDYPLLLATPSSLQGVSVGEVFTVAASISNLGGKDLYGFDITFKWNAEALEYLSHEVRIPVEIFSGGMLHDPVLEIVDEVSALDGVYSLAYASMLPAEPFNDDGVVFTITFVLRQPAENAFGFGPTILVNSLGELIPLSGQSQEVPLPPQCIQQMTELRKSAAAEYLRWWVTVMRPRMCSSSAYAWGRDHN